MVVVVFPLVYDENMMEYAYFWDVGMLLIVLCSFWLLVSDKCLCYLIVSFMVIRKIVQRLLTGLLAVFCVSCFHEDVAYGSPSADFVFAGTAIGENGDTLRGIVVAYDRNAFGHGSVSNWNDAVKTDDQGRFKVQFRDNIEGTGPFVYYFFAPCMDGAYKYVVPAFKFKGWNGRKYLGAYYFEEDVIIDLEKYGCH